MTAEDLRLAIEEQKTRKIYAEARARKEEIDRKEKILDELRHRDDEYSLAPQMFEQAMKCFNDSTESLLRAAYRGPKMHTSFSFLLHYTLPQGSRIKQGAGERTFTELDDAGILHNLQRACDMVAGWLSDNGYRMKEVPTVFNLYATSDSDRNSAGFAKYLYVRFEVSF